MTTVRSSNWSITINNPTDDDVKGVLPGWKLEGQYEEGKEGTTHFQGYLKTPWVRFSAIKAAFPRAHIEVARDVAALKKYVHKEETRVGEFTPVSTPNIFQLQETVADLFDDDEFDKILKSLDDKYKSEAMLRYVDSIVTDLIRAGVRGIEFTSINPMWRSSWKNFGRAIIARHRQTDRQTADPATGRFAWLDPSDKAMEEAAEKCEAEVYGEEQSGEDAEASPKAPPRRKA